MLGVVPEGGDGVAVEIAHHLPVGAERADAAGGAAAGVFRKQVFLAVVDGLLLGRVGVVLRTRVGLGAVETEGIGRAGAVGRVVVRIIDQHVGGDEIVHLRRMRLRNKWNRPRWVGRFRIGSKIMIERAVLVEDDHEMLDRRFRVDFMRVAMIAIAVVLTGEDRNAARDRGRTHRCCRKKPCFHFLAPDLLSQNCDVDLRQISRRR